MKLNRLALPLLVATLGCTQPKSTESVDQGNQALTEFASRFCPQDDSGNPTVGEKSVGQSTIECSDKDHNGAIDIVKEVRDETIVRCFETGGLKEC